MKSANRPTFTFKIRRAIIFVAAFGFAIPASDAALPPLDAGELQEQAELIVTGQVKSAKATTEDRSRGSDWIVDLTLEVETIEKGTEVAPSDTIEVQCWTVKERPDGWAGPGGHGPIPAEGARVRLWLRDQVSGSWRPLAPNGIELLDGSASFDFSTVEVAHSFRLRKLIPVIAILGLAVLGVGIASILGKRGRNRAPNQDSA